MPKGLLLASILLTACINSNAADAEKIFLAAEKEILSEEFSPKEKMVYDKQAKQYVIYKRLFDEEKKKHVWIRVISKTIATNKTVIVYDDNGNPVLIG